MKKKNGLYDAIHAKRKRIEAGSGEKMRTPGSKGAPTAKQFKQAAKTAKKWFSDSRLKENVVKVGEVSGINIYSYNYLGDTVVQRGVMAQELLGTDYADAVEMHSNGFYQVDYNLLPELH